MRKYKERERDDHDQESKTEDGGSAFSPFMNGLDDAERVVMTTSVNMHDALSHQLARSLRRARSNGTP